MKETIGTAQVKVELDTSSALQQLREIERQLDAMGPSAKGAGAAREAPAAAPRAGAYRTPPPRSGIISQALHGAAGAFLTNMIMRPRMARRAVTAMAMREVGNAVAHTRLGRRLQKVKRTVKIVAGAVAATVASTYVAAKAASTSMAFLEGAADAKPGALDAHLGGIPSDLIRRVAAVESWITSIGKAYAGTKEHAIAAARVTGKGPELWKSFWMEHAAANAEDQLNKKFNRWKAQEVGYVFGSKFLDIVKGAMPF